MANRIVVMGVSGCGKTSVGKALAQVLGAAFVDGDDLHPQANRDKMASGTPLTDDDRWPWLDRVGQTLAGSDSMVVACSALKRVYRERVLAAAPDTVFVHLTGTRELLAERMQARTDHFMPVSLLDSQLATLQQLEPDEPGFEIGIARPVGELVPEIIVRLERTEGSR